jgi:hypothetical protein
MWNSPDGSGVLVVLFSIGKLAGILLAALAAGFVVVRMCQFITLRK